MASKTLSGLQSGKGYEAAVAAVGDGVTYADSYYSAKVQFILNGIDNPNEGLIMADKFGAAQNGRVQLGGRFYAVPATDVETSVIYMPKYANSPFFGITERPVAANKLGAFATEGVFAFDIPDGFVSSPGQAIYYKPTSATTGTLSATPTSGSVRIGYEVAEPGVSGKLCIFIAPGNTLEA